MKIADLAKKLNIAPTELRRYIDELNIDIGKKARTVKDETAQEIIEKITAERELLAATEEEKLKQKPDNLAKKPAKEEEKKIKIPEVLTVKEFSARLAMPVTQVITQLIKEGIMASINENIDYETAAIIAEDLGYEVTKEKFKQDKRRFKVDAKKLKPRPPVVVVMGHVDHGKTTLLDKIRFADVVATESGGITQHIGAYQVEVKDEKKNKRAITFLDTPGHKAFTAMREHGAKITDIAILVVAADDGVKPQTKEAADYAKAAGVPIIVAVNKVDKPNADIAKTKKELADIGLATEDWGGDTPVVEISAKSGKGVKELLDMVLLVADVGEFKADPTGIAWGVVIEAHMDNRVGPVATVLVQKGQLEIGDAMVCGEFVGKIKIMQNYRGERQKKAYPSDPVLITGLSGVPNFGVTFEVFPSLKEAKVYIEREERQKFFKSITRPHLEAGEIESHILKQRKELNLIIKADVVGSVEAISNALSGLAGQGVKVKMIKAGAGTITENDVLTAQASGALILGFRVTVTPAAQKLAQTSGVKISTYQVIYELIDDVTTALAELIEPEEMEEVVGKAKVLKIFTHGKNRRIIGGKVISGKINKDGLVNVLSGGKKVGQVAIDSLQVAKEAVPEVLEGSEFGAGIRGDVEVKEGDALEVIEVKKVKRKIEVNV